MPSTSLHTGVQQVISMAMGIWTSCRMVWRAPVSTAVAEETSIDASPLQYSIGDAYPNPFDSSVSIPFDILTAAHVEMAIFSVTGQRVLTLTSEMFASGHHVARWDGTDRSGRNVASGTYVIRLTTSICSKKHCCSNRERSVDFEKQNWPGVTFMCGVPACRGVALCVTWQFRLHEVPQRRGSLSV
jgi:hypothetical protein